MLSKIIITLSACVYKVNGIYLHVSLASKSSNLSALSWRKLDLMIDSEDILRGRSADTSRIA